MVNYCSKNPYYIQGLNTTDSLPFCSNLLSFQGKFIGLNIAMVIYSKMAINYCSVCFVLRCKYLTLIYNSKPQTSYLYYKHGKIVKYTSSNVIYDLWHCGQGPVLLT
jgi:hypothetical protein